MVPKKTYWVYTNGVCRLIDCGLALLHQRVKVPGNCNQELDHQDIFQVFAILGDTHDTWQILAIFWEGAQSSYKKGKIMTLNDTRQYQNDT